jgi:hypothetical protein
MLLAIKTKFFFFYFVFRIYKPSQMELYKKCKQFLEYLHYILLGDKLIKAVINYVW